MSPIRVPLPTRERGLCPLLNFYIFQYKWCNLVHFLHRIVKLNNSQNNWCNWRNYVIYWGRTAGTATLNKNSHKLKPKWAYHRSMIAPLKVAPCGLRGCKNWPAPFPGRMSFKATKPGLVSVLYLSMQYMVILEETAVFQVLFLVSLFCACNITTVEINSDVHLLKS